MAMHLLGGVAMPAVACIFVLLTAAIVLTVIFDIRFLIVALMIIFIVTPMILSLVYFNYGLRPEYSFNVLPHRLTITPDGLRYDIYVESSSDDENDKEPQALQKQRQLLLHYSKHISYSSLRPYTVYSDSISIPIRDNREKNIGMVWIPESAFPDGKFADFIHAVSQFNAQCAMRNF